LSPGQRISGLSIVLNAEPDSRPSLTIRAEREVQGLLVDVDGLPIVNGLVLLTSLDRRNRQTTDASGRFVFPGLTPGTYALSLASPELRLAGRTAPGQSISGTEAVVVQAERVGSITGNLRDEFGETIEGATVSIFEVHYIAGRRRLVRLDRTNANVRTDEAGRFELHNLSFGEYYVGTLARVFADSGPTIGHCFYPGTNNPTDSRRVRVSAQSRQSDASFSIVRAELYSLSGRVIAPNGASLQTGMINIMPSPDAPISPVSLRASALKDGQFILHGVPSGQYTVQALSPAKSSPFLFGAVRVQASESNELLIQMSAGHSIEGVLQTPTGVPTGVKELVLQSVEYDSWPMLDRAVAMVSDGQTFQLAGVHGRRSLRVPPNSGYVISDVRLPTGASVTVLDFDKADLSEIRVTVVPAGVVEGRVSGAAMPANVTVVAWSTRPEELSHPTQRILSSAVNSAGLFRVIGLPHGSYWVAAFRAPNSTIWQDPAFLRELTSQAVRCEVVAGQTCRQDVKFISLQR
jgi:hypothetical protein